MSDDVEDEKGMRRALEEAARARAAGEVPIGAVILLAGTEIGSGFNQPIGAMDPTAHAEVLAMRAAARAIGNYRLVGATLYVTVEPCLMCVGAMVHARIRRVVFGALETKSGALVSTQRAHESAGLNHRVEVVGGVCEDQCRGMLHEFFAAARARLRSLDARARGGVPGGPEAGRADVTIDGCGPVLSGEVPKWS